jgi:Domain of unknown function (DUF4276)
MARLLVHVEGQTEETFVNVALREHLISVGYLDVRVRLAGNPRKQRGGIRPWQGIKRDVLRHLKEDRAAVNATMVDYYGLPKDWPGRDTAPRMKSSSGKAEHVELALLDDMAEAIGAGFDRKRFVPLVLMHEFEALLFSDPDRFAQEIGKHNLSTTFRAIREEFETPEDINDSTETAPSKRIERLFPGYEKPLFGVLAALGIGLTTIRQECPHFNSWVERLEALPGQLASTGA